MILFSKNISKNISNTKMKKVKETEKMVLRSSGFCRNPEHTLITNSQSTVVSVSAPVCT